MNVYLNKIDGIADAVTSMYFSKTTWTREKEERVREVCGKVLTDEGFLRADSNPAGERFESLLYPGREIIEKGTRKPFSPVEKADFEAFDDMMRKLCRIGKRHITLLRFIDFSITTEGIHRGGQDDIDAHAKRFENRIIRSSTRLGGYTGKEVSDFYSEHILPTDKALSLLGVSTPDTITHNGVTYVRTANGYIEESLKDDKDYRRGLYMLSIPSNFIGKINLTEWAHVYKERRKEGGAHPEVKEWTEAVCDRIEEAMPYFNRELFMEIRN